MLKFLSKVKIEFNAFDSRAATCLEFLAQCKTRKSQESNPACQLEVKRRTDEHPPQITITYINGVQELIDASSTPAHSIRKAILDKGQSLETQQMFKDNGESWPVLIPEHELNIPVAGTKDGVECLIQQDHPLKARSADATIMIKIKSFRDISKIPGNPFAD